MLYLSYDGMCDPLGGSQVLPYLFGLAEQGHKIDLISFEKPERSKAERALVARTCAAAGIRWHPLRYHKHPPVVSSIFDVWRMQRLAERLHEERNFDLLHCRSYLAAIVGLAMKRRHGIPFVFDMRGFWADERVDGEIWKLSNPLLRAVYNFFKRREREFLCEASHVVSLTDAGREILLGWRAEPDSGPPITVIPCCVDFDAFPPIKVEDRIETRRRLAIPANATVAAYLGSLGTWYMAREMMDFFRVQLERDPNAIFLIISHESPEAVVSIAQSRGIPAKRLIVRPASRAEVPTLLAAADYGLFFIRPVFSKKASSPTKMGEFFALEIPIVTNGGVGDVIRIVRETGGGVVVDGFHDQAYRRALDQLHALNPDIGRWREAAHRWFDLQTGIRRYDAIYGSLTNGPKPSRA